MAVVNFNFCLVLMVCRLALVFTDDGSSEVRDLGANDRKESENKVDGVRCYCNTALCVSTGYMCRAPSGGGCYSDVPAPRRAHHASHGCLHHLADTEVEALSRCQNTPSSGAGRPSHQHSLLLCCFHDLCNHEDSPVTRARLNITSETETNAVATERGAGYNGGEVWFKAATIAVPVCGALILFILVAVAVRLLRTDALLHADRKLRGGYMSPLGPNHGDQDVKKVWVGNSHSPLLVTPSGCLVAVERAQLVDPSCQPICDIQR